MPAGDPRLPPPFDLNALTPDRFEALVYRLAWLEDKTTINPMAPDHGLDAVVLDADRPGRALRGFQAKRFNGPIDWAACEHSLDRAAAHWAPRRVTFAFSRALTAKQVERFHDRLASRHASITADFWDGPNVQARLRDEPGMRVAAGFFRTEDEAAVIERALRAGNALAAGADFASAELSLQQAYGQADADYDWIITRRPAGHPDAPDDPASIMKVEFTSEQTVVRADLVPRNASPVTSPRTVVAFDDTDEGRQARAWFNDLMTSGGTLVLSEGVSVTVADVPAPLGDLFEGFEHERLTVRVLSEPAPYYARLTAGQPGRVQSVDVDLLPQRAHDEWDATLGGAAGNLAVSFDFRWDVREARGRSLLRFAYTASSRGVPHEVEAQGLRWLIAMLESGRIVVTDRAGVRPDLVQQQGPAPVPDWLWRWADLHEQLAELQRWSSGPLPAVPEEVTTAHAAAVAKIAAALRDGGIANILQRVDLQLGPEAPAISRIVLDMVVTHTVVANVFGEEVPVARQRIRLPPMIIVDRVATADGGWHLTLEPLAGPRAHIFAEFERLE
ncbi:MAG: hypothetical protein WKF96_12870 [Solirubrobacteraceae bacterium]